VGAHHIIEEARGSAGKRRPVTDSGTAQLKALIHNRARESVKWNERRTSGMTDRNLRDRDRRERDAEEERNAERERRGEELREAWRRHHPAEEGEKSRPKKDRPS
jgi:hypothetical protein